MIKPAPQLCLSSVFCRETFGAILTLAVLTGSPLWAAGPDSGAPPKGQKPGTTVKGTTVKPKPVCPEDTKPARPKTRDDLFRDAYANLWEIRRQVRLGTKPVGIQRFVNRLKESLRRLEKFDPKKVKPDDGGLKAKKGGTAAAARVSGKEDSKADPKTDRAKPPSDRDAERQEQRKDFTLKDTFKKPTAEEMKLRHYRIAAKATQKKIAKACREALGLVAEFEKHLLPKKGDPKKLAGLLDDIEKKLDTLREPQKPPAKTKDGKPPAETVVR